MAASIRKAFRDIFSPKYNKAYIAAFFIFIAVLETFVNSARLFTKSNPPFSISILLLFILVLAAALIAPVLNAGFYAAAVNNELYRPKNVIPPFSEFGRLLGIGAKSILGNFILGLIPVIVLVISALFSQFLIMSRFITNSGNLVLTFTSVFLCLVFFVLFIVYNFRIVLPLNFIFMHNFQFSSFFKFKETGEFLRKRKGHYLSYILRAIFAGILTVLITIVLAVPLIIITAVSVVFKIPAAEFFSVFYAMLIAFAQIFSSLLYASLAAQFIKSVNKGA